MTAKRIAAEILNELQQHATGSRQGHRPSAQSDLGVYNNNLRAIIGDYKRRLKDESAPFLLELAQVLIGMQIVECRALAYELVGGHRAAREALNLKTIESLGRGMDNWACVDRFCCTLVGTAWREGRISDAAILRWSRSKDLWWRRAAVVATVPLNMKSRGGTGDTSRTLMICELLLEDREAMIQKAISWALRELVRWDRAAVEGFLDEYQTMLPALVRREVRRKLDTGKKN